MLRLLPVGADMTAMLWRFIGGLALAVMLPRLGAQAVSANDAAMALAPNAAALERGKAIFRLNECNYCHGIDLTRQPRGARADLKHNPLVGADENGELIGAIVRNGLPASQTSMPSFGEVITPEQIVDLAAYIHFQRQAERFKELVALKDAAGSIPEGKAYFEGAGKCGSCHTPAAITVRLKESDAATLKQHVLRPPALAAAARQTDPGYRAHQKFTERVTDEEFLHLLAFLNALK